MRARRSVHRVLIRAALALAALAACATPQPGVATPPATSPPATSPPSGHVSFMIFGDPAELRAYQNLVGAFEQGHPAIRVELIHIPSQTDYRQRLALDFAAGAPADVVLLNYRRYADFAAKGMLEPLQPYLATSTLIQESDFYSEALAPFRWNRELMCLPQNVSSLVVYYNKDAFDAAGLPYPDADWTRDDFVSMARTLTRDIDGDGRIDQHGVGIEPSLIRLAPFIWQNRGSLVKPVAMPFELALDEPPALAALQWFVDLRVTHHVTPDAVEEESEDSESRFLNGRVAMFFNSRRGVPTYRTITVFDWDVAPLPRDHGRRANVLHADGYCMAALTADKRAAWTFIEFANSPKGQTIVAASGRTVPSLISVANSPAFLDPGAQPANSRVFLDAIPTLFAMPVVPGWGDIEAIADAEIERAFYGAATITDTARTAVLRSEEYFNALSR